MVQSKKSKHFDSVKKEASTFPGCRESINKEKSTKKTTTEGESSTTCKKINGKESESVAPAENPEMEESDVKRKSADELDKEDPTLKKSKIE